MKAIVVPRFGGPEVLEIADLPIPTPGPGQVLIRVSHSGVNFADINSRRGSYASRGLKLPLIPGLEVAGIVEAVGEGVTQLRPGQRVAAFPAGGSYAEYVVAREVLTYAIPDDLSWEQAASFLVASLTAYLLLTMAARIQPGESVLIHAAAGGVGTTLQQIARLVGAGKVLGTAGSDEKVAYASTFGADEIFNYRSTDFGERVLALTDGRGVDIVLDSVGGPARARSLEILAPRGRIVLFGNASGAEELSVPTKLLREKTLAVIGFALSSLRQQVPERLRDPAQQLLEWLTAGRYRVDVSEILPLDQAAEAHRRLEGRETRGRLLLHVADLT